MLQETVDWSLFSLAGLDPESHIGAALSYFIYDSIKILALLFLMIFIMGTLRTYLPQDKVRRWLGKRSYGIGNVVAAGFGAVTPFCSCSSIPIFMGFLEAGVPLGVSFSFLITSPMINEYLVVLMLGFFGWKITIAYVAIGLLIGIISGLVLGRMRLEKHLVKDLVSKSKEVEKEVKHDGFKTRLRFGAEEAIKITKKLWIWVLVGVGIGALIHNVVPEETIHAIVTAGGIFTVPAAVLVGVPMYGSCAAIVPIAVALFQKGAPLGTALAFMMATAALSLPEAVILRRVMRLRLILIFFGIVAAGIVVTGYLINFLQPIL
ncbi:TPA: permease [Candidatus Woesearchaeota archaeon]|nr:permease [Candidatus Woesearchaeota archaeon]